MVFSLVQQSSQALQRYIPSQVIAVVAEPEQQINNSLVISTVFFSDKEADFERGEKWFAGY